MFHLCSETYCIFIKEKNKLKRLAKVILIPFLDAIDSKEKNEIFVKDT